MKASLAVPLTIVGIAFLAVLATFGLAVGDLRHDPVTRELWVWAGRFWTGLCGALPLFGAVALLFGIWHGVRWLNVHAALVYHQRGNLPASADPRIRILADHRNEKAEIAQAVFDGKVDRANGSGMRALLAPRQDEEILQLASSAQPITTHEVLDNYDPQREPHWLLIGQTGSGKSHGIFSITQNIARRYRSEFLIAERGGIDWNAQADAMTIDGYANLLDTVEQERQRRSELMRSADVDHISGLRERLPLLVVVIEEAESIYGRLFELDRTRARQFVQALRDIASLGRKQGIALVIATQTGTSGVFDAPTRRNLGNTLIFRSEAIVGDQFGVPRAAGLATLPSGTAYALKYGAVVEFPLSSRPTLPHASLYHEDDAPLLLTADAEADGLGDNDLPDGTTDTTVYRSEVPQNGGNGGGHNGIPVSVPQDVPPVENDKKLIYTRWKALQSLKAVERELYGQAGGVKFYWVRDAVNEMRLRRGQAPI